MVILITVLSIIIIAGISIDILIDDRRHPLVMLGAILISSGVTLLVLSVADSGYRNGQIDALSGKVYYHLVDHPDGTRTWEKIQETQTGR